MGARRVLIWLGCVVLGAAATAGLAADRSTRHGHGGPAAAARLARTRCIGIDHVAGAIVFGDRAVELTMTDHSRWRMTFDAACPALSFYQGFYYRRAIAGHLCASRDAVISRAGGTCPIATIVRVRP